MNQLNQDKVKEIKFPNDNRARLVTATANTNPADIVAALGISPPKAVIVLSGGAHELADSLKPYLLPLFSQGIARTALDVQALIIDGGTLSGVMEMMGQGVAAWGRQTSLLGVAPAGLVTYPGDDRRKTLFKDGVPLDPNHSHFVLVESDEWGGEIKMMQDLAAIFAQAAPVVMILVNGGNIAKQDVLWSTRHGWPVVVIQNSGRLADEIATLWEKKPAVITDPALAEIIAAGDIHLYPYDSTVAGLRQLLTRLLGGDTHQNQTTATSSQEAQ